MSSTSVTLTAADGHSLMGWLAEPAGTARGGVIVVQEIMGVNHHIRAVAEGFASDGYRVVAPALFDRIERGVELGYEPADIDRGRKIAMALTREQILADVQAAITFLGQPRTGIVGYCFGGRVAWMAAALLPVAAASAYYGGGIPGLDLTPQVPTIAHFGARDAHIPLSDVETLRQRHPTVPIYVYDADHGFNCNERGSYDAPSAALARERTLALFAETLG
jgi:carboxymethylenebutenolidase